MTFSAGKWTIQELRIRAVCHLGVLEARLLKKGGEDGALLEPEDRLPSLARYAIAGRFRTSTRNTRVQSEGYGYVSLPALPYPAPPYPVLSCSVLLCLCVYCSCCWQVPAPWLFLRIVYGVVTVIVVILVYSIVVCCAHAHC